ncbi:hypothetical protein CSB20_02560 [bacterium DOLZORAL124_64_63]|nr:MAG: hypothetical protein CSB20_02560 [bacterium DOLZORAL124_64_63]
MVKNRGTKHGKDKPRPEAPTRTLAGIRLPDWGRWVLAVVCLWAVLAFVYGGALTQGQVFQAADTHNAEAFAAVGDAGLAAGHYPLWNPYLFAGMPSFGSVAYLKYVYPPSVLFNTLQGWGLPPLTWMFGHLLFGGLGMFWLLRRWELPLASLLLGAVVFLLFPKVVAWGVHGHGSKLGAAMYLPWIVGSVWRVLDGRGWRYVGWTALLLGLQLLRSHPQISFYTLGLVAWLTLWNGVWALDGRTAAAAGRRWGRAAMVLAGLVVGFMIAAILLLPMQQYAGISIRGQDTADGGGVGLDYATGWSLAPGEYGSTLLPMAAGFGKATYMGYMPFNDYPNYFGFLLLALAAAACMRGRRSLPAALAALSLLAVFVSWGNHGFGFYEWIYGWVPFFNKFRVPSMILILPAFAAAILAPLGATRLAGSGAGTAGVGTVGAGTVWRGPLIFAAILAALGLMLFLGGLTGLAAGFYRADLQELARASGRQAPDVLLDSAWNLHRGSLILIGLVLLTAGAATWARTRATVLGDGRLAWVLMVLMVVDLGAVDRLIVHPDRGLQTVVQDPQGRARLVPSGALLRKHRDSALRAGPGAGVLAEMVGHDRVYPLGAEGNQNIWMADGIRSLGGYHPAKLAAYEQIRKRLYHPEAPALELGNWLAGRVLSYGTTFNDPQLEALATLGADLDAAAATGTRPVFYPNRSALPRARLMDSWTPVSSLPEKDALEPFLDGIQAGRIDVRRTTYLLEKPVPEPQPTAQELPVPVFVTDGLDEVVLRTESPTAALLLLADMMVPGWKVEVDGRARPLLRADLVLRAVALEAGSHTVRFHYSDPAVSRGLTLTLAGGTLTLLMILLPSILPRRRRSGQETETS